MVSRTQRYSKVYSLHKGRREGREPVVRLPWIGHWCAHAAPCCVLTHAANYKMQQHWTSHPRDQSKQRGQQILCGRRSNASGFKPPSLRVGLLYINLEPVAKGSLGLFHRRIQAKKRKHVVQGFCTGRELLLVVWIWAAENLLVWISNSRVSVDLAHPDFELLVQHEVHAKNLEVTVWQDFESALHGLPDVQSGVRRNLQNLLPKSCLVKAGVMLVR